MLFRSSATRHRVRLVSSGERPNAAARLRDVRMAMDTRQSDGSVCGECVDIVAGGRAVVAGDSEAGVGRRSADAPLSDIKRRRHIPGIKDSTIRNRPHEM